MLLCRWDSFLLLLVLITYQEFTMSTNLLSYELLLNANNLETLKQLVLNGADINYQAKNGWCLLFELISLNRHNELEYFASKNLNIFKKDIKGRTAIFWAIYHNKVESLKVLLKLGCNVNKDVIPSLSSLHYAVYKNNLSIIKTLLDANVSINKKDKLEHTALSYASLYEHKETVELLKSYGAL